MNIIILSDLQRIKILELIRAEILRTPNDQGYRIEELARIMDALLPPPVKG